MRKEPDPNLEGDVVLIHFQDKPAVYARIEAIEADIKKDWYQVTLLMLTLPSQTVTWILREEYINGGTFTMGGQPMKLEKVKRVQSPTASPKEGPSEGKPSDGEKEKKRPSKVIPLKK